MSEIKQPMQTWSHNQLLNEINRLKADNEKLQAELARVRGIAERVCEFYGSADKMFGGKLAREMANELKEGWEYE